MKRSVRNSTLVGVFATATAFSLQVVYIVFQTDPGAIDRNVTTITQGLVLVGVITLVGAYLEWKQHDHIAPGVGLFLVGNAGLSLSIQFTNAIVGAFYPRIYIIGFLEADFLAIAWAGLVISIIGGSLKRAKPSSAAIVDNEVVE